MLAGKSDLFYNTFVQHSDFSVMARIAELVEERYGWDVQVIQEKENPSAPHMLFVSEKSLPAERGTGMILQGEPIPEIKTIADEVLGQVE